MLPLKKLRLPAFLVILLLLASFTFSEGEMLYVGEVPGMNGPRGVRADALGNFVVSEGTGSKVHLYDKNLQHMNYYGLGNYDKVESIYDTAHPDAIDLDQEGNLYFGVLDGGYIKKYSMSGQPLMQITLPSVYYRGFLNSGQWFYQQNYSEEKYQVPVPNKDYHPFYGDGIAVKSNGDIYVSTYNDILIFDRGGNFKKQMHYFDHPDTGSRVSFRQVKDIAFNDQDELYVIDALDCLIVKFDATDSPVKVFAGYGTGPGTFFRPMAICIDEAGRVYGGDFFGWINVFDAGGNYLYQLKSDTGGVLPIGTCMSLDYRGGRLYVAEVLENRVTVFESFPLQ